VAALLATLGGPTGGFMLNAIGDSVWEMVVGPVRIAWGITLKYGAKVGARVTLKSVTSNWNQLTGPDLKGTQFGALYVFNDLSDEVSPWVADKINSTTTADHVKREYQKMMEALHRP
jgi:hypothetical protein